MARSKLLTRLEVGADGRSALFGWDGLTSEFGGKHDIRLTLRVTLEDVQAVFAMTIENHSGFVVENVYCPYLGDVQHPQSATWFKTFSIHYATATNGACGQPTRTCAAITGWIILPNSTRARHSAGAPMSPFILLRSERQGLYVGVAPPAASWWRGTPSCAPVTAARSIAACQEALASREPWPPASPRCTCPTSSLAKPAR